MLARDIVAELSKLVSAGNAAAVEKHDATNFTNTTRAIYVGTAGDVVAVIGGAPVTFKAVPAGTVLPVQATRINSTGTTAADMVALW